MFVMREFMKWIIPDGEDFGLRPQTFCQVKKAKPEVELSSL